MPLTIGEKIKQLRKEQKLTQAELAGTEMTKSMLSQIENNLARPSMKNLRYLASKLNKSLSYFLDEDKNESKVKQDASIDLPIDLINNKLKEINTLIENNNGDESYIKTNSLLNSYNFNKKSVLYANIVYNLGCSLILLHKFNEGEEKLHFSINIYLDNFLYNKAARANLELIDRPWSNFDYEACLKILYDTDKIYNKAVKKDIFFEIEFLYSKAIIHSAMEHNKTTLSLLKEAINLSKQENIYYKTGELYRIYAVLQLATGNYENYRFNIKKAKQYAEFTENKKSLAAIEMNEAIYNNSINSPKDALKHIKLYKEYIHTKNYQYYLQKSISYYLLERYDEALELLNNMNYPDDVHHRIDYSRLWSGKIYEGLILYKLGNCDKAIKSINTAIDKLKKFTPSPQLAFAYKSISEIYSENNNYEEAFNALKNSTEILTELKKFRQ